MQKVALPSCDVCESTLSVYRSEQLGVQLCYQCIYTVCTWVQQNQLLVANPLIQELFDGLWDSRGSYYRVWFQTPGGPSNSSSDAWVKRVEKEL